MASFGLKSSSFVPTVKDRDLLLELCKPSFHCKDCSEYTNVVVFFDGFVDNDGDNSESLSSPSNLVLRMMMKIVRFEARAG